MNYIDKLKISLKAKGEDESLIDLFLSVETIYYMNKDELLKFSLFSYLEDLHLNRNEAKSVFNYSNFCSTQLSLKGCNTFANDIVNESKQQVFTKMKRYLKDEFPEFNVLGDIRAIPEDIVKYQIEESIERNEKKIESYIRTMIQSLGVELDSYEDNILNIINNYVLNIFDFETKLPSELSSFDMTKADPAIIKKQINICIDKLLKGEDLDGMVL